MRGHDPESGRSTTRKKEKIGSKHHKKEKKLIETFSDPINTEDVLHARFLGSQELNDK